MHNPMTVEALSYDAGDTDETLRRAWNYYDAADERLSRYITRAYGIAFVNREPRESFDLKLRRARAGRMKAQFHLREIERMLSEGEFERHRRYALASSSYRSRMKRERAMSRPGRPARR